MTTAPFVELRFNPTDLRPRDLPRAGAFLGSPADAIEASLSVIRAAMVDQMKSEVRGIVAPTQAQLLRIADLAWQAVFWKYRKISAPVMADAYVRAYRRANAGDVPMSVIYDLADKHAEKVGDYFHTSSREALAEGFNSMVNRQVPAKAAADRVMDAYGLTNRQMRGYTSGKFDPPVWDVRPRALKARARAYIDRSFTTRLKKLSEQEEHNIDQQAQQFAWMWLQDKGHLNERAQKMWITAHDERVCPMCGPLHGQKVLVNEQFKTAHGEFWTPGLHPNCRCVVRLIENRFTVVEKKFDPHQPREADGRWGGGTSTYRQHAQKLNALGTVAARPPTNRPSQVAHSIRRHVVEPRYLLTPLAQKDREMLRLSRGAMVWSQSGRGVDRVRRFAEPDQRYYANLMRLRGSERAIDHLVKTVEAAPANAPVLYRGLAVTPEHLDDLKVGSSFTVPLSAFSTERKLGETYARTYGPLIARNRAKRQGTDAPVADRPVIMKLEAKAQAVNISQVVAERNAEWLTAGEFVITDVRDDDGLTEVTIKQISNRVVKALQASELREFNQLHPRAEGGRFGVKARTKTIDVDTEFESLLAAQPKTKPVTETDTKFAEIIAGQPQELRVKTRTAPVSTKPKTLTDVTVQPEAKVETKPELKVAVKQAMLRIAPPELKTEFIVDLVVDTRIAVKADPQLQAKTKTRVKPPTTKLDAEAFAVITREQLSHGHIGRINLNKGIQFSTDEIQIASEAADTVEGIVERKMGEVKKQGSRVRFKASNGQTMYADVDEQDLEDMVDWHARTATSHWHEDYDPDSIGDAPVKVQWYDENTGDYVGKGGVPYSWLGQQYNLETADFEVYMVRADEAHFGEEGVEDVLGTAGSKVHGYEMDGWFEMVPDTVNRTQMDHTFAVTSYKIQPSGIHEELPEPFVETDEGWEEGE